MSSKPFLAGHWLARNIDSLQEPQALPQSSVSLTTAPSIKNRFPTFNNRVRKRKPVLSLENSIGFQPAQFLTPGWQGDSLTSKASSKYIYLLDTLKSDVLKQLSFQEFNRSLKLGIYNEFLSFANDQGLQFCELGELSTFWSALKNEKTEERPNVLNNFLDLYCYRVSVITLFKLRFISMLSLKAEIEINSRCAHNPNHWLSQVFKVGTKNELKARVTEANIFSWYRPGQEMSTLMNEWMKTSTDVSIAELIKLMSPRVQDKNATTIYSHSLSHLNFGLFLNSLLINFPLWVETQEPTPSQKVQTPEELEIISCKFSGDYLESLALSHWLAQLNNKDMKWDQILCPVFKGKDFESGLFFKVLNELQFLTFLAEVSEFQNHEPVCFISKIMGHHYQNRKGAQATRGLSLDTPFSNSTYDRNILNLTVLPKNNPYHWMMNQLEEQSETLKSGGWLVVLGSKSLFAPSQRERLKNVLQHLELKAVFDMENIKGKGELSNWIYVFRRRQQAVVRTERESLGWFRFTADMTSFHEFADITESLRGFYMSHLEDSPSMWQHDWGNGHRLEFFQEAIIDGHLIHSSSEDQNRVTHPSFFKALMSSCVPLESAFDLRPMNPEEWQANHSMNLGLKLDGATFLMVDCRQKGQTRLSLHPITTIRAIYYEYGSSLCHYFLISSKHNGIDPNILRKYFNSQVGQQLVDLSFTNNTSKVKSQLSKILVPKWFLRGEFIPEHLKPILELFDWTPETLTACDSKELIERFNYFKSATQSLFPKYACDVLGSLVAFEQTLQNLVSKLSDPRLGSQLNFHNTELQHSLANLKSYPLLRPVHPDIFVEFSDSIESSDLELPLSRVELKSQIEGDLKTWILEICHEGRSVVRLHSEESLLLFTQFIVQSAIGRPISQVLRAIRLPLLQDMSPLIQNVKTQQNVFNDLLSQTTQFLEESFRMQLFVDKP